MEKLLIKHGLNILSRVWRIIIWCCMPSQGMYLQCKCGECEEEEGGWDGHLYLGRSCDGTVIRVFTQYE